jgi:coenzyme PQQ synthesis protein D (PqqD)
MAGPESLTISDIVVRADGLAEAEIDGEVVALNIERGLCYGLNHAGSRVWRLLAEPTRVADLCGTLESEYAIDSETCRRQVLELLEDMRGEGLIAVPQ